MKTQHIQQHQGKPVTPVELVLVERKGEEIVDCTFWKTKTGKVFINRYDPYFDLQQDYTPIKPIFISRKEKIEVGDYRYNPKITLIDVITQEEVYKVVVLPEQFTTQLLQQIVSGELKEKVSYLLECEPVINNKIGTESYRQVDYYQIKLPLTIYKEERKGLYQIADSMNDSVSITVKELTGKEEEKMYSREEVIQFLKDFGLSIDRGDWDYFKGKEWFEQNVK